MSLTDELDKLSMLHAEGALTDYEFSAAKDKLLQGNDELSLRAELEDLRMLIRRQSLENEVSRVDNEWQTTRMTYMSPGGHGSLEMPSIAASVLVGIIPIIIGTAFMVLSYTTKGGPPHFFGLLPIAVGVATIVIGCIKAARFNKAQAAYQLQRKSLLQKLAEINGTPQ